MGGSGERTTKRGHAETQEGTASGASTATKYISPPLTEQTHDRGRHLFLFRFCLFHQSSNSKLVCTSNGTDSYKSLCARSCFLFRAWNKSSAGIIPTHLAPNPPAHGCKNLAADLAIASWTHILLKSFLEVKNRDLSPLISPTCFMPPHARIDRLFASRADLRPFVFIFGCPALHMPDVPLSAIELVHRKVLLHDHLRTTLATVLLAFLHRLQLLHPLFRARRLGLCFGSRLRLSFPAQQSFVKILPPWCSRLCFSFQAQQSFV